MRYLYEYKNVKAENFSVRGIKKRRIGVPEQLDFPEKVVDFFRQYYCLDKMPEEYMYMICFNSASVPVSVFEISHGGIDYTVAPVREIYLKALLSDANNFILIHNHPSGICTPSSEDDSLTKRLVEAGGLLGIPVVDHVIIGKDSYYSYAEQNEELLKTKQVREGQEE